MAPNRVNSNQQTFFKNWWKNHHNHFYGIFGILGVVLAIIFFIFPKENNSHSDQKYNQKIKPIDSNNFIDFEKIEHEPLSKKKKTAEDILNHTIDSLNNVLSFVSAPKNGRIRVMKNEKYGFTDIHGKLIINNKYDNAGDFSSLRAIVNISDTQIIIDTSGNVIKKMEPNIRIITEFFTRFAKIHDLKKDKLGFINVNGEIVIPPIYDSAGVFHQGLARVFKNDKWGYINNKGEQIVPHIYDDCFWFKNGMAVVAKNSNEGKFKMKYGYINLKGDEVIPLIYDLTHDFHEGFGLVYLHPEFIYLDYSGKEANPSSNYLGATSFRDGEATVIEAKDTFCINLDFQKIECSNFYRNPYTLE